jgi:hypothetical protein
MRVYMLRNPANHLGCKLSEGETGVVNRDLGERLVRLGIAEISEESKPTQGKESTVKGVPNKPAMSKAKPAEIAANKKSDSKESAE